MATRTIEQLYLTYQEAVRAVADLTSAGVPPEAISLIEGEQDPRLPPEVTRDAAESPARTGAMIGLAIGGGIGVLEGVGSISIPGLEPLAQMSWLVPTVLFAAAGAILGGIAGSVLRIGVSSGQAHSLATALHRGQHLVLARVDEHRAEELLALLRHHHAGPHRANTAYDFEPVDDERTPQEEAAAIHAAERRIDYTSE